MGTTSDCHGYRASFHGRLDHELEAGAEAALESHLAACPECRRALASLQATLAALARSPLPEPGPGFVGETLRRAVAARKARTRKSHGWAAAGLLALSAGWVLFGAGQVVAPLLASLGTVAARLSQLWPVALSAGRVLDVLARGALTVLAALSALFRSGAAGAWLVPYLASLVLVLFLAGLTERRRRRSGLALCL